MTAIKEETMLTGARIMAIVPTTDLARAKAFYGGTLGLVDANVPTPGRRWSTGAAAIRYSRSTNGPPRAKRSTPSRRGR
jgi:hypothetical protein